MYSDVENRPVVVTVEDMVLQDQLLE